MTEWVVPLISVLVSIFIALVGCITTMMYWGGRVMTKVEHLDASFTDLSSDLRAEILKRETEISVERKDREAQVQAIWKRIDELREIIANKIHG